MNNQQRDAIKSLRDALKPFMDLDGGMTLNRLEALLVLYTDGITDMLTLRDAVESSAGISKSAMSRMVSWWSDEAYLQYKVDDEGRQVVPDRPEGQGFIKIEPDPRDYRRRVISITPAGEHFGCKLADDIMAAGDAYAARWKTGAVQNQKKDDS